MTKKELINKLSNYPDNAEVTVVNSDSKVWSNICFLSWKNSSERVMLNFTEGK